MMPPTMPLTIVITSEPSTDHANPSIVTPTEKNDSANRDASCMNSQLITSATSPNEIIENGNAMTWIIGFMEALISAMNKANAAMPSTGLANGVHAGQNRNHNARRDGKN